MDSLITSNISSNICLNKFTVPQVETFFEIDQQTLKDTHIMTLFDQGKIVQLNNLLLKEPDRFTPKMKIIVQDEFKYY